MGGNSDYNIIRTPSKTEFDNLVINSDLNGTLNSDFNIRKINAWNYINYYTPYGNVIMDNAAFQDNTDNLSVRCKWDSRSGLTYINHDKDFYTTVFTSTNILIANFRPIIEYRE